MINNIGGRATLKKKLLIPILIHNRQTVCDKVHSQEGNSPDYMLRSPNTSKWKEWFMI